MVEDRWGDTHLEEGFHFEDCEPVHVNSIEHNVHWKDASLSPLLGKTVRLYILVQDANLYGFRFKQEVAHAGNGNLIVLLGPMDRPFQCSKTPSK